MPAPTAIKPTIVLVPGFWVGRNAFDKVVVELHAQGFKTHVAPLVSTGRVASKNPRSPSLHDDIAAVRSVIQPIAEAGETIILVLHSGGGFVGAAAIGGLSEGVRNEEKKRGGVRQIVAFSAAVQYTGYDHGFFEIKGNEMRCKNPRETLFNDIASDEEAEQLVGQLQCQPGTGYDATREVGYPGWKNVPSTYVVCQDDEIILPPLQEQLAEMVGASLETLDAGHLSIITSPKEVARIIAEHAKS